MEPVPTLELSEPILTRLEGSIAGGSTFSRPKKLVRLASSELVRLREVVFCSLAVSATETFTVITSPTCMARGSWKKLCAPGCHSELLTWHDRRGAREFRPRSGCRPDCRPAASLGASPILSEAVQRRTGRQRRPPASKREKFQKRLRMTNPIGGRDCWRERRSVPVARTVPGAIDDAGNHAVGSRILDGDGIADAAFAHGAAHGGQLHAGSDELHGDGLALGDDDGAAHIFAAERLAGAKACGGPACP